MMTAKARWAASIHHRPVATLLAISTLFEAVWFSIQNIGFHCDSPGYIDVAWSWFGGSVSQLTAWVRTIGYPLLIVLGGTVGSHSRFHSFAGILLIQAAMAVAMPALVFKTLEPFNRRLALAIAFVTIVSLQPYITSKLIMTEQAFKFLSVLLMYLAVKAYPATAPRRWAIALSGTCLFLALLRPAAVLMALIVFGALLISRRQYWKAWVAGFGVVWLGMFVNSFVTCLVLLPPGGLYTANTVRKLTDLAFYDLYIENNAIALDPQAGPRRKELHDIIDAFAHELKSGWVGRQPPRYFAPYANDPERWVDSLYTDPNGVKYGMLKDAIGIYEDQGSDLLLRHEARKAISRAIWEAYRSDPLLLVRMIFRYGLTSTGGGGPEILANHIFSWFQVAKFSPENGPASRELVATVRSYLIDHPAAARTMLPPTAKDYTGDPDGFIRDQLLGVSNPELMYSIWTVLYDMKDPRRADKLYSDVDREGLVNGSPHGPWQAVQILIQQGDTQLYRFFFGRYLDFDFFYNIVQCYQSSVSPKYPGELLSGMRLFSWVKIEPDREIFYSRPWANVRSWLDYVVQITWMVTHLACSLLVLIGAPFALCSRHRWPVAVGGALVLSHAVPSCFIVYAQDRYIDQILPLMLMLVGFVIAGSFEPLWRISFRRAGRSVNLAAP